jgi:hypothetical protein
MPVRVMVLDAWDEIALDVTPDELVRDLKSRALQQARVVRPADGYEVKFRGALVPEGGTTVGEAGVVPNANLIVLRRTRAAVR